MTSVLSPLEGFALLSALYAVKPLQAYEPAKLSGVSPAEKRYFSFSTNTYSPYPPGMFMPIFFVVKGLHRCSSSALHTSQSPQPIHG